MLNRETTLALILMTLASATGSAAEDQPLRVLLTVGGVAYHTAIIQSLDSNDALEIRIRDGSEDGLVFTPAVLEEVDAVLMYHRDNVADATEREALMEFIADGGGVVVLHHSIANYPDWERWWRDYVGGLYVLAGHESMKPSRYFYGFEGVTRPAMEHPITASIGARWRYADESYSQLWISDEVTPLLTTTAFGSDEYLAWIGPSDSQRVVYIQPGHGDSVLMDPKFVSLIENALRWSARSVD